MNDRTGLMHAYLLDGSGGGNEIGWDDIRSRQPSDGLLRIHLNRDSEQSVLWLREKSGLDELTCDTLLSEETRPRCEWIGDSLFMILYGVNLNEGAYPEDMISLRV